MSGSWLDLAVVVENVLREYWDFTSLTSCSFLRYHLMPQLRGAEAWCKGLKYFNLKLK